MPGCIHDFEQLLFFKVEVEFRAVGNLETFWQSQPYGLLREPVNQYPSKQCSRYQIALIGKFVETQGTAACQIEMVQHLRDLIVPHWRGLAGVIRRTLFRNSSCFASVKKDIPSTCFTRNERGMYFSIPRPDIQKLLVKTSRARFVRLASVNRIGTVPFV